MSRPFQRWAPPVAWASIILIATSFPVPGSLDSDPFLGADKLVHGGLYAVLGIAGSFVAGFIGQALGFYAAGEGVGFIGSVIGALIVLFVYGLVVKQGGSKS